MTEKSLAKVHLASDQVWKLYSDPVLISARLILDYPKRYIILLGHLACLSSGGVNKGDLLEHSYEKLESAMTIPEPKFNSVRSGTGCLSRDNGCVFCVVGSLYLLEEKCSCS
ncbi:MAG: hypothetical protein HQL97_14895 [Magnetococcales bacterium]|nr:hypothetical protein [Magnetococcales bacterium]